MDFQPVTDFLEGLAAKGIAGNSCAVMKDGELVYEHYTGYADLELKKPVRPDTLFRIYSMTKPFTCIAAMQLYEKGAFELQDPVSAYLPEFQNMEILYTKPNGKPGQRPALQPVRIYDLLGMTAGLTYNDDGGDAARRTAENLRKLSEEQPNYTTREFVRALASGPLAFEPGSHWRYGLCHDVLGALIETLSGERFSDYVEHHICRPLGLESTFFRCTALLREERLAHFYEHSSDGTYRKLTNQDRYYEPDCRMDRGGAGLLSTLGDYLRFAETLTNGGTSADGIRLIGAHTLKLMRTNRLGKEQLEDLDWIHYQGYGYGLGFRVLLDPERAGGGNIGEFGWSGMAGTWVLMDPEKHLTAVYMEQAVPSLEPYITPRLRNMIYACL